MPAYSQAHLEYPISSGRQATMFMRRKIGCVAVLLAAAGLSACGSGRPVHYFTVELPPAPQQTTSVYPITLLIGRIAAPEILQDEPIAYRSGPNEIGVYDYHHWIEPPVQMVRIALLRQLRSSGKYQSIADLGSGEQGEFVLQGRLYAFEEVDTNSSIAGLVTMEFELLDRKDGKMVWDHFYSHSEPVQGKEIAEVVSALNRNLDQGLVEMTSGLDAYFSAHLPGKP
jgi:ABC-type uncharacterized transport system auxiliary subunit